MNRLTISNCPFCESDQLDFSMKCTDHYASGEEFDIYQCRSCGFLFTQNAPTEEEIGRYYETPTYISHTDTKKGLVNHLYHLVRKRMLNQKARLIRQITGRNSGRLLDIGAGTGYFPFTMQQKGWKVEAVEKSSSARLFAKENFDLELKDENSLSEFSSDSFDVITLWHVLEHLQPLNETWERLYRLLKENGTLLIAVPNCSSYDAQKYGPHWAAYDVPRHLWHFTPHTIQQFGNKHGFILSAQYPMPYDAYYVSMLSEKYKNNSLSFLKGALTGISGWLHTQANKERSSSIIYVFRKKK